MEDMNKTVIINGIEYEPVDMPMGEAPSKCLDCDIYKAKPPLRFFELPLCCEDKYSFVNESCWEQGNKGIIRIWKIKSR